MRIFNIGFMGKVFKRAAIYNMPNGKAYYNIDIGSSAQNFSHFLSGISGLALNKAKIDIIQPRLNNLLDHLNSNWKWNALPITLTKDLAVNFFKGAKPEVVFGSLSKLPKDEIEVWFRATEEIGFLYEVMGHKYKLEMKKSYKDEWKNVSEVLLDLFVAQTPPSNLKYAHRDILYAKYVKNLAELTLIENTFEKYGGREKWEKRLQNPKPLDIQERDDLFSNSHLEKLLLSKKMEWEIRYFVKYDYFKPLSKISIQELLDILTLYELVYFALLQQGFGIKKDKNGKLNYPQLVKKIGWVSTSKANSIKNILERFSDHLENEVFKRFPVLKNDPDLLRKYGAFVITPDYLESHISPPTTVQTRPTLNFGRVLAVGDDLIQIINMIAKGGMGEIYSVDVFGYNWGDTAIKVFCPDPSSTPKEIEETKKLFFRENHILSYLLKKTGNKICFPQIFTGVVEAQGYLFFVMEYLEGMKTLAAIANNEGVPYDAVTIKKRISLAINAAEVLSIIHCCGVIYRDLKPENIMFKPDRLCYIDFGIAKILAEFENCSSYGTPGIAPPEQYNDFDKVDQRADIYSFGALLYWMFTGDVLLDDDEKLVFAPTRRATAEMKTRVLKGYEWKSPCSLNSAIPKDLEKIIFSCLQKRPDDRYQTMEEVIKALENLW